MEQEGKTIKAGTSRRPVKPDYERDGYFQLCAGQSNWQDADADSSHREREGKHDR